MKRLEAQIAKTQNKLCKLREEQKRRQAQNAKRCKPARKRGRPPIDENVLIRAVKLAETRTLPHVAMKLGISLTTLYNKGIKRYVLDKTS